MSMNLDSSMNVVKSVVVDPVDMRRRHAQNQPVNTIAERIDWVLENRKDLVKNARQWGIRAGMSHGTVPAIYERNSGMNSATAQKLAAVAKVSTDWLSVGVGDPDRVPTPLVFPEGRDPLMPRRIATKHARNLGALESVMQRVVTSSLYNTTEHQGWKSARWVEVFMSETIKEMRANPAAFHAQKARLQHREEAQKQELLEAEPTLPKAARRQKAG